MATNIAQRPPDHALGALDVRWQSLVQGTSVGIYCLSADGRVQAANAALVRMLDYDSEAELIGLAIGEGLGLAAGLANCEEAGGFENVELEWARKSGERIIVRTSGRTLTDSTGVRLGYEGVVTDVTEQRQLEAQLRQHQKMAVMGRLAAEIAHDFNNVLSVILGYGALVRDSLDEGDPRRQDADEVLRAADLAASLTHELLSFSRRDAGQAAVTNLNTVIEGMARMLRRLIGAHIDLTIATDPDLAPVKLDPTQIKQALINLVVNAQDAMPGGGTVTIETANVVIDDSDDRGHGVAIPERYVMLAVTDVGCGMDADMRAHLFEPFFTTKRSGTDAGLGLATVYGIVKQNGGFMRVDSEPNHGTTIRIYLPPVNEAAEVPGLTAPAAESIRGGSETILIVEDEDGVRTVAADALSRRGYRVLSARHADEALRICESDQRVDLLVVDIVLPGTSGPVLAQQIGARRPGVAVIFTSGYGETGVPHRGILEPTAPFLPKPFTPGDLARHVRQVLDAPDKGLSRPVTVARGPAHREIF